MANALLNEQLIYSIKQLNPKIQKQIKKAYVPFKINVFCLNKNQLRKFKRIITEYINLAQKRPVSNNIKTRQIWLKRFIEINKKLDLFVQKTKKIYGKQIFEIIEFQGNKKR